MKPRNLQIPVYTAVCRCFVLLHLIPFYVTTCFTVLDSVDFSSFGFQANCIILARLERWQSWSTYRNSGLSRPLLRGHCQEAKARPIRRSVALQACGYIGSRCCVGLCVVFYVYCLCLDAAGGDGGHQHSAWSGSKIISVDNELMVIWCVTCTVWAYTLSSMVGVFIDP